MTGVHGSEGAGIKLLRTYSPQGGRTPVSALRWDAAVF